MIKRSSSGGSDGSMVPWRPHRLLGHRHQRRHLRGPLEQPLPRRQLPQEHADAEDVGARIDRLPARLLGRHVRVLALEQPRLRLRRVDCAGRLGDAEVDQLDRALVGDQHVLRRDVAVHEAERLAVGADARVRVVQAAQHVGDDAAAPAPSGGRLSASVGLADDPAQVLAVHVLHGDEVLIAQLAQVEDLHHVRVVEPRRDPRLVEEHLDERVVAAKLRQDALDHHQLLEALHAGLLGQEDLGHAALGELALEDVLAELLRGAAIQGCTLEAHRERQAIRGPYRPRAGSLGGARSR